MTKREYEAGKGWCELCVILCYDCLDEEKYGPPEPLDFPSARTVPEVTNLEPEDPGPPPNGDWLTPILYKGRNKESSTMAKIVRGVRTVQSIFRFSVDHARRLFR
jgi:hypothetical protein